MVKKLLVATLGCMPLYSKDIILWDLHNVVFTRSIPQTMRAIVNAQMLEGITQSNWTLVKKMLALTRDFIIDETSVESFIHAAQEHNNHELVRAILAIANAQESMPGIESIISELHALGFEQHIGSNIGKTAFENLIDPTQYPQFASIFSHMDLDKSQVVSFDPQKIIQKPNPAFFTEYLEKNNLNPQHDRIFFIDDKIKNITIANQLGLIGILFKDSNQLRRDLIKKGILVAPPRNPRYRFDGYQHLFQ